jgi:hypothetical protein
MCLRAVFKISEHALVDHNSKSTEISTMLAALAVRTHARFDRHCAPAHISALTRRVRVCTSALLQSGDGHAADAVWDAVLRQPRLCGASARAAQAHAVRAARDSAPRMLRARKHQQHRPALTCVRPRAARCHWTVGWGLLVLGIIANIIYISLEARPLTRVY